jgi:hypothetical protein
VIVGSFDEGFAREDPCSGRSQLDKALLKGCLCVLLLERKVSRLVSCRVVLWTDDETASFARTAVDRLDNVD